MNEEIKDELFKINSAAEVSLSQLYKETAYMYGELFNQAFSGSAEYVILKIKNKRITLLGAVVDEGRTELVGPILRNSISYSCERSKLNNFQFYITIRNNFKIEFETIEEVIEFQDFESARLYLEVEDGV